MNIHYMTITSVSLMSTSKLKESLPQEGHGNETSEFIVLNLFIYLSMYNAWIHLDRSITNFDENYFKKRGPTKNHF